MIIRLKQTKFACIVADPAWKFKDSLPGNTRGAAKNYHVEMLEKIKRTKLPPIADDAYLFMWRVSAMVPEAYEVVKAWEFNHKSEIVWNKKTKHGKQHFGMGHHVRASHESCIIATRGRPERLNKNTRSLFDTVFEAVVPSEHSKKPDEFYALIEAFCNGPRVELFAREQRKGWTCLGDEMPNPTIL